MLKIKRILVIKLRTIILVMIAIGRMETILRIRTKKYTVVTLRIQFSIPDKPTLGRYVVLVLVLVLVLILVLVLTVITMLKI